jgi:hypothetical protein
MLHVVLAQGLDAAGYTVTTIRTDGIRVKESREGPGFFGIYGEAGGWWCTDRMDIAHVEVTGLSGGVTILHNPSFPPGDCWMCGSGQRKLAWRLLQDRGDPEPYGVMAWDTVTGQHYLYVRGEGLVPWPAMAAYTLNGEPGSRPIAESYALRLIVEGVGRVEAGAYDPRQRGQGDVLPLPTGDR